MPLAAPNSSSAVGDLSATRRAYLDALVEDTAADPALLRAVAAAAADGTRYLRGASPEVYKALHVAGLAQRFERVG